MIPVSFLIMFIIFHALCSYEPRRPYWNDFKTTFLVTLTQNSSELPRYWKSVGDIYYKGSKQLMRVDWLNYCEPHFNFTKPFSHFYTCSYIFHQNKAFYRTDKDCCMFKTLGALKPSFLYSFDYYGTEVMDGKLCNKFGHSASVPAGIVYYYADYSTMAPVAFTGGNAFELKNGALMEFVKVDESSELDDELFKIDEKCLKECPYPPLGRHGGFFSSLMKEN